MQVRNCRYDTRERRSSFVSFVAAAALLISLLREQHSSHCSSSFCFLPLCLFCHHSIQWTLRLDICPPSPSPSPPQQQQKSPSDHPVPVNLKMAIENRQKKKIKYSTEDVQREKKILWGHLIRLSTDDEDTVVVQEEKNHKNHKNHLH